MKKLFALITAVILILISFAACNIGGLTNEVGFTGVNPADKNPNPSEDITEDNIEDITEDITEDSKPTTSEYIPVNSTTDNNNDNDNDNDNNNDIDIDNIMDGWFGGIVREGKYYHDGQEEWVTFYYADVGISQLETLKNQLDDYYNSGETKETEIQIYTMNGINLKDFADKQISFKGEFFAAHTIHHRRDIVFEIKEIYGVTAPSPPKKDEKDAPPATAGVSPGFGRSDIPFWFNGYEIFDYNFAWDKFEDGSGEECLMILVDAGEPDGAANDTLYLPGYGAATVGRHGNWIYVSWGDTNSENNCVILMFELESQYMAIHVNVLKGVKQGPDSDTIKMPVSVRRGGDPDCDQYYVPLYAILTEIGGGVIYNPFGFGAAYIYSGDALQEYAGFWESTDRGEERADAVIDGVTHSIVSYWTALELRGDGTFTDSTRFYQSDRDWVLIETGGRYIFRERMLIMLYETESVWRGPDYAALMLIKTDEPIAPYITGWYITEWDEDYFDIRNYPYYLYGFLTKTGEASPRPGKIS
jgi:hypothetical protein